MNFNQVALDFSVARSLLSNQLRKFNSDKPDSLGDRIFRQLLKMSHFSCHWDEAVAPNLTQEANQLLKECESSLA